MPPPSGAGPKFALGPAPLPTPGPLSEQELPPAYGTGRLFLTPRDPHCLYACWDLTAEQQRLCNSLSLQHHLVVRLHEDAVSNRPVGELHVHPESRHWFIHVEHAGRTYIAELGYPQPNGQFHTVVVSDAVATPAEDPAEERTFEVKSVAFEPAARPLAPPSPGLASAAARPAQPATPPVPLPLPLPPSPPAPFVPVEALPQPRLRAEAPRPVPTIPRAPATPNQAPITVAVAAVPALDAVPAAPAVSAAPSVQEWTPVQERALAELIGWTLVKQQLPGSEEILALLQRPAQLPVAPVGAPTEAGPGVPGPEIPGAEIAGLAGGPGPEIFSPPGGEFPAQRGFWFNFNTELVVYGATEPGAQVSIGGRPIQLRPDGSFSYRFALPDGYYRLPLTAVSPDGDTRQVMLEFYRGTRYRGEVGAHPQDPSLQPPPSEGTV